ncbi:uncharacterized protein Z518_06112 [Rhinocladiella mackenziei CBS 650.93]|uniref:F-box domain-containing protein n=1 Tax=Rhinocladiella mackenziei CBS 650.93 TaxID=1442369 RepID=A0A0D2J847_9EURO|nr:uncharacterized protein Z518_06112 [Rhinocladiella mackenziei CBS 650.93]KIX05240.1 hypothetical protein Z518_06112 [Rhinocladiella mackenziei CBS 650.93]
MVVDKLPLEIFSNVIDRVVTHSTLQEGFRLRTVNRAFNREIQASYFDRETIDFDEEQYCALTYQMGDQHILRYMKGLTGARKPKTVLAANLQQAVEILASTRETEWQNEFHTDYLPALNDTIHLEVEERCCRIKSLVALTVLSFVNVPSFSSVIRLGECRSQMQPLSWAIITAILLNSRATVEALLKLQTDVRARLWLLADPVYIAAREKNYELVRLLLDNNADVNLGALCYFPKVPLMGFRTILEFACSEGDITMVDLITDGKYCLQSCSEPFESAINITVLQMVDHPSKADDYLSILRILFKNARKDDAEEMRPFILRLGITYGIKELVQMSIDHGLGVNDRTPYSPTPLYQAADSGRAEITGMLLDQGAEQSRELDHDAVQAASLKGHVDVLRLLLTRATSINDYGHPLLAGHLVVFYERHNECVFLELLKCVCEHGFDLNAARFGTRAMSLAFSYQHRTVQDYLHGKGIPLKTGPAESSNPKPAP